MVKTKLRHPGTKAGRKSGTASCLIDTSEFDQHDKDDWVIVKKQRVTILIPAVPLSPKISITATHGPSNIASSNLQLQTGTSTVLPSVDEQEKTTSSLAAQKEIQEVRKAPPLPNPTSAKNARIDRRIELEIPRQVSDLNSPKLHGASKASIAMKQPRLLLAPSRPPSLGINLNQGLRASNLERKLERAGGLSKWLTSLGLGQFVRIFQGKSLNKYQLVNLTMKKLKDMGANAVGPRRKLIHAIDCVCQPYCFEAL